MEKYPHYLTRLQNATRKFWDKPALNDIGGDSYTFGQMAIQIEIFHCFFEEAGVKEEEHIAICAANGSHWGMAYMSVVTYKAVVVPILFDFTPDSVSNLLEHSDSIGVFTNIDKWKKIDPKALPKVRFAIDAATWQLIYYTDDKIKAAFDNMDNNFQKKHPNGYKADDVVFPDKTYDKLAMINYTSGSTGNPKGVMLTDRNFSATVDYCQRKVPAGDKMVSMLPMAHMYGLVIEFIYPVCNGTSIYWLGKAPTPTALLKAFADVKPYLLITVPLVIEKIFKAKIKPQVEKPMIKFICKVPGLRNVVYNKIRDGLLNAFGGNVQQFIMGGAPLNPEVERWLVRIKFPYLVGYGMTEANPLLAYEHYTQYVPGSCGKAVDCTTVRIDSEDQQHVVGEIQAKGDNICLGYYKNPEATAEAFTDDGFLKTGDLGIIDAEGNIFIRGRIKNLILSANGQNIYPEEVEAIVNNQPYVLENVVVDRGGKLVALVYLDQQEIAKALLSKEDAADIPNAIRLGANKTLPSYSKIATVELVDKPFEKTPKMSIKRYLYK